MNSPYYNYKNRCLIYQIVILKLFQVIENPELCYSLQDTKDNSIHLAEKKYQWNNDILIPFYILKSIMLTENMTISYIWNLPQIILSVGLAIF